MGDTGEGGRWWIREDGNSHHRAEHRSSGLVLDLLMCMSCLEVIWLSESKSFIHSHALQRHPTSYNSVSYLADELGHWPDRELCYQTTSKQDMVSSVGMRLLTHQKKEKKKRNAESA